MINNGLSSLVLTQKQLAIFLNSRKKCTTRAVIKNGECKKIDHTNVTNSKSIIAMDNYFIWTKVIAALQDLGIGIIGTVKYQFGWHPVCLEQVKDTTLYFNDLFWTVDKFVALVACWIDN